MDMQERSIKKKEQEGGKIAENKGKNPVAVALGRLGVKKGGPAKAKKLLAERRREIACK